jgi:hypothetical protein
VAGAHQRLGADQAHGLQVDLGLVELLEQVVLEHIGKGHLAVARQRLAFVRRKQVAQSRQHETLATAFVAYRRSRIGRPPCTRFVTQDQSHTVNGDSLNAIMLCKW